MINVGNDLSTGFVVIIFICLIVAVTSFFVFTGNGDIGFSDAQNPQNPFEPDLYGDSYNETTGEFEDTDESTDWWGAIGGFLTILAGVTVFTFTFWTGYGAIAGAGMVFAGSTWFATSLPGGSEFVAGIPIIGNIVAGINYVTTALASFWNLMSFNLPYFGNIPIFGIIIGVPIMFFFFVFIIRFIRGQ